MTLNEYSILKGNAFTDIPLINEFWTSERVWRMFIYKYGKRKIFCVADMFSTLTQDFFAANDVTLRGIISSQLGFTTNEYSKTRSLQTDYGKTETREKDDTTTETKTHSGTDTTTNNTTKGTVHSGTDTTTDSTTKSTVNSGTDTTEHSGNDVVTESVTTFDNITDFKNKEKNDTAYGETETTRHGKTVNETNGGTIAVQHGESINETNGGTIAIQHGETVTTTHGGDYQDTVSHGGRDTEYETESGFNRPAWLSAIEYNNNLIFALNKILELFANFILLKIY